MSGLADDVFHLLQRFPVTQGSHVGDTFKVLGWQKRLLRGIVNNRTSAISVARGNGKTTLLAGVASAALIGPLRQRRGEVVVVASSHNQARILFEHVLAFLDALIRQNRRRMRIADSQNVASIEDRETGCRVRCIGSDPRRAHGLAPVLTLCDEPAQWEHTKAESMVAALRTASGKIPGSRLVMLGTRPADPDHFFAKALAGDAGYAQTHAAGPDDPPFQRRTWKKANPSLDYMPDLEEAIRDEAALARRDPAMLAAFRALRLNQGTSDVEIQVLLDTELWRECEGDAERQGPCVWGIDLGTSAAQSAIAAFWPATGRLEVMAAFPSEPSLAQRGLLDGVGNLYVQCAQRGELIVRGGRAVDVVELMRHAFERFGRPAAAVSDRWRYDELVDALTAASVPPGTLVERGMGYKDGAQDVRDFRRACAEGRVSAAPSLLLRSAMAEARCVSDPAGNAKLAKASQGGRRLRARDDAAAAAILAVASGVRRGVAPRRILRHALAG